MKSFQILTLLLSTSTLLFSAVQAQHFDCSSIMPEEPCMKDPEKCFREWEAASAFPSPPPYVVLKSYSNSLELNITSEERTALTNSLHNINATSSQETRNTPPCCRMPPTCAAFMESHQANYAWNRHKHPTEWNKMLCCLRIWRQSCGDVRRVPPDVMYPAPMCSEPGVLP